MTIKELHQQIKNDYMEFFPFSTFSEYEKFLKGFYLELSLSWKLENFTQCDIKITHIKHNEERRRYTVFYKIGFKIVDTPYITTNEIEKESFLIN